MSTSQQNSCHKFWTHTWRDLNFWSWHIQINQKSWNIEILQNSIEFRWDFKLGIQSLMMKFFATTYSKNMTNISFDNQSVVGSIKIIIKKFASVFIKIWIFEVDTFKSIKNHEILRFCRILLNFDTISKKERNPKNMIGLSSDKLVVVLINKTFVTNFESLFTEI